ncbi:Maf family protein [Zongyangia hominis]|uniref:dTTP/UTP pyrophosphatase n=1 Tax=Zongyangia hominis TaxID=2763677 RepID=A0A926EE07_9FIRM|nr:Maf family protein [Zongyangia hominis]MBC8571343.1 septum formation inhibitor Maf [Zongyangia hominis]
MQMILASQSPRRKELLAFLGHPFLTMPADADESIPQGMGPEEAVRLLARRKANLVAQSHPDDLVIGADTVVAIDGRILGKPESPQQAAEMLALLSGRIHSVYTGVCLQKNGERRAFSQRTRVAFYPLTQEEIAWYLDTGEPFDKAGAYGVQGFGSVFVKGIEGDYFNVMGLPIARLCREIQAFCPGWKLGNTAAQA